MVDIRDLISLEDVMEELELGPNGGLMYCMEYLLQNLDWLEEEIDTEWEDEYVIIDCPGRSPCERARAPVSVQGSPMMTDSHCLHPPPLLLLFARPVVITHRSNRIVHALAADATAGPSAPAAVPLPGVRGLLARVPVHHRRDQVLFRCIDGHVGHGPVGGAPHKCPQQDGSDRGPSR